MKKSILIISIAILGLITGIIISPKITPNLDPAKASFSFKPIYKLSTSEAAILDILLKDEGVDFAVRGSSMLNDELPSFSTQKIAATYASNQVDADQQYYNKKFYLTGIIQDINSGLGNEPYVVFYGANLFRSPQAHFTDGNIQKIATLKRGQKLNLVCKGNGAVIGTPLFSDCQFAEDYASNRLTEIKKEIYNYLNSNKPVSKIGAFFAFSTIALAESLPASSTCFTNQSSCAKELKAIASSKEISKAFLNALEKLKHLGIQLPKELEGLEMKK